MTDAANIAQMLVRFLKIMPQDIDINANSAGVRRLVEQAWDNGWTDPAWLANVALLGVGHPTVNSPAALFAAQLREAASMPCPVDETPTPPSGYVDPAPSGPPAKPEAVAVAVDSIRKQLKRPDAQPTTDTRRTA